MAFGEGGAAQLGGEVYITWDWNGFARSIGNYILKEANA